MKKRSKRPGWAVAAAALSILAIIVELSTKLCTMLFDPLPDAWCVIAYGFLPAMMLVNEYVLSDADAVPQHPSVVRRLCAASAGTALAIMIALLYSVLFIPALPYSLIALMIFGAGVGAWSPFLNLAVLLVQCQALHDHLRFRRASDYSWRLAVGGIGVTLLIAVTAPLAPSNLRYAAFQHMPGHIMFSSWWKFVHGQSEFSSD
jgi:hypothetical protein